MEELNQLGFARPLTSETMLTVSKNAFKGYELVYIAYEVVRLAKYNLYQYIGCIIYQSNWSGPFSLVVMKPDL